MESVKIVFSIKELFDKLSILSYNLLFHGDSITSSSKAVELCVDVENFSWFLSVLRRADGVIRGKIEHVIDKDGMLEELKRLSLEQDDDSLVYVIKLSHSLQMFILSDAIEDALIAEVYRHWALLKGLKYSPNYNEVMDRLKSISLMVERPVKLKYRIN